MGLSRQSRYPISFYNNRYIQYYDLISGTSDIINQICHVILFFFIHGAESVYQFFADFQFVLAVCFDDDISRCLVFSAAFLHQICDKWNSLIVLDQRTVMVIFDAVKDCLRLCCEENNTAILLHLYYIALSHWSTTAAGDHNIAA